MELPEGQPQTFIANILFNEQSIISQTSYKHALHKFNSDVEFIIKQT